MRHRVAVAALGVAILALLLAGVWRSQRTTATVTDTPAAVEHDAATTVPPAGTVDIAPAKQQLAGIAVERVQARPQSRAIRVLGRVAIDEARLYVINATVDGWILEAGEQTTGTRVRKGETLATFYSPEFLSAVQALFFALDSRDRVERSNTVVQKDQLTQFNLNLRQFRDSLRNLGMGEQQIEDLIRTRTFGEQVRIAAPADGVIVARNVSHGLRFDKGKELYRIANLDRVWVVADVFEQEARYLRPGTAATVSHRHLGASFTARVSDSLPQFDGATRTLKVRLLADNPGLLLRPDMFVDVDVSVGTAPVVTVPADAVLDSGLTKLLYVAVDEGRFEPRRVETGARLGDRVEILSGLQPGESIVVSGNFFVDSESRMRATRGRGPAAPGHEGHAPPLPAGSGDHAGHGQAHH